MNIDITQNALRYLKGKNKTALTLLIRATGGG